MLNNEPAQLDLLKKLQEATTSDVDEERGSFKEGDKVTYDMLGSGLTDSDLIKMLGTNEHATRVNHNETLAEIVEAIGEEVARYSIMFEDGFVINDVATSELKSVKEAEEVTEQDIVDWLDEGRRWLDIKEGEKTELKGQFVEIVSVKTMTDPYARFRPQDLYYVVGRVGSRWFSIMYGTDEGLLEDEYVFEFASSQDTVPSMEQYLEHEFVEEKRRKKTNESYSTLDVEADIKQGISAEEIISNIRARYPDIGYEQARQIYNAVKTGGVVDWSRHENESKINEAEEATQTMKPQEKPNIKAEDFHMEDYSEDDLEKVKSKSAETGNAIRQVDDKELVVEPDKVVEPKKESKVKEAIKDYSHDQLECLKCGYVKKIPYFSGQTALCPKCKTHLVPSMSPSKVKQMVKKYGKDFESKLKEQETEFTPSRSEMSKITDEKLRELHKNALRSLEHWEKDGTVPEKVELTRKAVARYEEAMVDRGLMSKDASSEKKESKFSFMKKQEPLWLCDECHKTFRADKGICENCKSENVERITEQGSGPGFTKEVFQVTWKNTDTGKEESTRVMAFDKADAKREAKRSNREITKVKGPITEEPRNEDITHEIPGVYKVIFYDEYEVEVDAVSKVDAMAKAREEHPEEKRVTTVMLVKQKGEERDAKSGKENKAPFDSGREGSKIHEDVQELVREVPGINKEEQEILLKAIEDGVISNEWPTDEEMVDALSKAGVDSVIASDVEAEDFRIAYIKHILLTKAIKAARVAKESKVNEEEEDWDITFLYKHNLIWHNPMLDKEGEYYHWQKSSIKGKRIQVFTDYQAEWVERNKGIPVMAELVEEANNQVINVYKGVDTGKLYTDESKLRMERTEEGTKLVDKETGEEVVLDQEASKSAIRSNMPEAKKEIPTSTAIEIVRSTVDPDAWIFRVVELPSGSSVNLDTMEGSEKEALKKGKEMARSLGAEFLGVVDEKKEVKEQEEDTFTTVAKGIVAKTLADEIAAKENGQVVADEDDDKKFMIITKVEQ